MNYLAHAYLSFNHDEILIGNLVSDFVKGKKKFDYPEDVQKGIILHRAIDTFTDGHEIVAAAKEIFRADYRLYNGAFIDVAFDHYLANDASNFNLPSLAAFSQKVYDAVDRYHGLLPERFARMFPYMKSQDWLYNYHSLEGIGHSFTGLVRRSKYLTESQTAYQLLVLHFNELQQYYNSFFPELKSFAHNLYVDLLK